MENKLEIMLKESNLEATKTQFILDKFKNYFEIAAEWEKKAKAIVITNENQTMEMQMARTGRLFLREKRIAVEKARKELKEQALREGKAIDGIANVLKALIVPIEQHLEQQEKFVEIQEENKREAKRLEIERRMEEERIVQEKADIEEHKQIRAENERLRKESEIREKILAEERRIHNESIAKERAKADAEKKEIEDKATANRKAAEEKARKEREAQEKKHTEEMAQVEFEKQKVEDKAQLKREKEAKAMAVAEKKAEAERKEKERLAEIIRNQIACPKCGYKFQLKKG